MSCRVTVTGLLQNATFFRLEFDELFDLMFAVN